MKNKGWVKLWRDQFNNWVSERKPWCDGYAWSYLYAQANHKGGTVNFRNEYIPIERGEFLTSKLQLQKKFGWTYRHVENFLKALENDKMVRNRTTNRYILITIINYEKYQGKDDKNDEQNEEQIRNRLGTGLERGNTNKNVKNVKNKKKKISFDFKNKTFINLTKEKMEEFDEKYPGVNVDHEIEEMENWLIKEKNEEGKNKIPKDYNRFIHNWLKRSNE